MAKVNKRTSAMFGISEPTGSHLMLLEPAARAASGLVIEHGAGFYSTPLLARLGCRVLCYEQNDGWREWAAWIYQGRAEFTGSLRDTLARVADASLVFIDGSTDDRVRLLDACLAASVPTIVAHDTHPRGWEEYGWRAEHFSWPGYVIEHDNYRGKYQTTRWSK